MIQRIARRFHRRWRALRVAGSGLRDDAGNALVELMLMLGFLGVPLFLGTVHFAWLTVASVEVANSAHAGAEFGMTSATDAGDGTGIIAAAKEDSPTYGSNMTVTPTVFFACSATISGTQYATQSAANTACTGGSKIGRAHV